MITSDHEEYKKLIPRLASITITNFQTKNRLERLMVKNCYSPKELQVFENGLDDTFNLNNIFETCENLLNHLIDGTHDKFPIFVENSVINHILLNYLIYSKREQKV